MASEINVSALSINADEAKLVSEIIAPLIFENPDFLKYHNLVTGIERKTQIVLDSGGGRAGILDNGCTRPEGGGMGITLTQLFWELVTIGDTLIHCQADLDQNFKMTVKKFAADHKNLEGSPALQAYIIARVERFIKESMMRLVWLGDKAADTNANAGYLKDTVAKTFYNSLDGIWAQSFVNVGLGTTPRYTIAANAEATKTLQMTLAADAGLKALEAMFDNASDNLKGDANKYFILTPALFNNYVKYLSTEPLANGGLSSALINGIPQVMYMGIPVAQDLFIGNLILNDMNIETGSPVVNTYNLPHRGILTTAANVPIATLSESDIRSVESFYYLKDRTNYMAFAYDLDVKVLRGEMVSVAY